MRSETQTTTENFRIRQSVANQDLFAMKRPIVALSIVLTLMAITVFYLFWRQAASVIETSEKLSKTREVVSVLDNTLSTLRDAESSERGYVVSADPTYMKAYYQSRELLNQRLINLQNLASTSDLKAKVSSLEELMRKKVLEMDRTVGARTPENFRDAWLLVVRGQGKQLMDEITAQLGAIKGTEEAAAARSANSVRDAGRNILTTLPIIFIVSALMVALLVFFCFKFSHEKKLGELQLNQSYKLFESFMDNSPGFAFIKDKSGKYLYVNKSLADRFAQDGEPVFDRRDADWLPAEIAKQIEESDKLVLTSNMPVQNIQVFPNKHTGTEEMWMVIKFPVTDLAQNGFVAGVAYNVSDIKKAERQIAKLNEDLRARVEDLEVITEELEQARDQAVEASKVKSQFIANMSHEIRTPMSGVLGMSELLLENDELDSEAKELVGYVHSSATNLLGVVNDLLDFAKLEAGKVILNDKVFSVEELLRDAVALLAPEAQKKSLQLLFSVGDDVPNYLIGDSSRLNQVILNLAHNAVKFTHEGTIKLSANLAAQSDNNVLISFEVSDTGIGITDEVQRKLFEPFVQADGSTTRQYGGTGLGLSICKSLVELMSGRIGVKSETNLGSTFWFTVPLQMCDSSANSNIKGEAA